MSKTKKKEKIVGTISLSPKGFGFVEPSGKSAISKHIFIPKGKTLAAADNDLVEVEITSWKDKSKGPEGEVLTIIERSTTNLIGVILEKEEKVYIAYIRSKGVNRYAHIESVKPLNWGDLVLIKIIDWTDELSPLLGTSTKHLGNINDPTTDISVAIEEFGIKKDFDPLVIKEAKSFSSKVKTEDLENRVDLTLVDCITIDPVDAKDFDDAVSCSKDEEGNYHLGVHIADVSHYIKQNSALDKEALSKGNSTYFPNQCIPMLPPELSNELCSLKEKEIRLCITVEMNFNPKGQLLNYKIFKSYIRSRKRLTYDEAFEVIQKKKKSPFFHLLDIMVELGTILKNLRLERGGLDFSLPEAKIEVDEHSLPTGIKIIEYDISHQIIEEFMLKANEIVATDLHNKKINQIYRIHEKPSKQQLQEFYDFVYALGIDIPQKDGKFDISKFFKMTKTSPIFHQISLNFLRSLKMAFYLPAEIGHYGLALEHYCHFTSPIRRYSDLITQRLLFNEQSKDTDLEKIAKLCSQKERNSFRAETNVIYQKKLRLLELEHKKDPERRYKAIINKIKPYTFSFELTEFFLEGTIHLSEIHDDFYLYNPKKMRLEGQRTNKVISYGDEIIVKIDKIDFIFSKIYWKTKVKETKKKLRKKKK